MRPLTERRGDTGRPSRSARRPARTHSYTGYQNGRGFALRARPEDPRSYIKARSSSKGRSFQERSSYRDMTRLKSRRSNVAPIRRTAPGSIVRRRFT